MKPSNKLKQANKKKRRLNGMFLASIILVEAIIITSLVFTCIHAFSNAGDSNEINIYSLIALGLILLWIGVLTGYYAWVIYFYNINLGITDSEWAEVRERYGYIPVDADDVRNDNPHKEETLGLPPGTIRGTIALTLLIAGLAMTIASLGMDSVLKANSFLVDHFDFLKTAFLMMIAFYFGNKALKTIGYKSSKYVGSPSGPDNTNYSTTTTYTPGSAGNQGNVQNEAPVSPMMEGSLGTNRKNQINDINASTPEDKNKVLEAGQSDFFNSQAVQ